MDPKGLFGESKFGSEDDATIKKLFDTKKFEDYTTAAQCYAGIVLPAGQVGILEEVKIFVRNLHDKTPYVDNLKF